jgi:tryptophan 2,3-dioxygenase
MRSGATQADTGFRSTVTLPVAGAGAGCATDTDPANAAEMLRDELRRRLAPRPLGDLDGLTLARLVTRDVRWNGTHHLDPRTVAGLAAVRDRCAGRDPMLDAFLDCVLAKHDGRYWNRTYLCLPVLERLVDGPDAPLGPVALAALLAADIVRYELCASHRGKAISPLDRPDGRTLRTRVRHAARFEAANLGAEHATELLAAVAHDPEATLSELLASLPVPPAPWAADWLEVSVQPVSTVHDEYFFIRALQAHEMMYTVAGRRIADAATALVEGQPERAARRVDHARVMVERGQSLFRMVATMRYEAFHTFREFTQGASAIQSEQYKRFESRCWTPSPDRLASPAFASVPAVRVELAEEHITLMDAWLAADRRRPRDPALARVATSMAALEAAHRRWKGTHLTVATRMLGSARGSGDTSGVPYLQSWVEHRLFGDCPAVRAQGIPERAHGHVGDEAAAEIPVPRTGDEPPVDVAAGQSLSRLSRR